jgi:hypothetical protein
MLNRPDSKGSPFLATAPKYDRNSLNFSIRPFKSELQSHQQRGHIQRGTFSPEPDCCLELLLNLGLASGAPLLHPVIGLPVNGPVHPPLNELKDATSPAFFRHN